MYNNKELVKVCSTNCVLTPVLEALVAFRKVNEWIREYDIDLENDTQTPIFPVV